MVITPTEIRVNDDRHQDLLADAEWRSLATCISAFVALVLGMRG